jgi:hypothetical protein
VSSRLYYIKKRAVNGVTLKELPGSGDEFAVLNELVANVYRDLAKLIDDGDASPSETFDIIRGLEAVDKDALMELERPHQKIRVNLIDELYEISVVNL